MFMARPNILGMCRNLDINTFKFLVHAIHAPYLANSIDCDCDSDHSNGGLIAIRS